MMLEHSGISEGSWAIQAVSGPSLRGENEGRMYLVALSLIGQHFILWGTNSLALLCSPYGVQSGVLYWHP